MGVILFLFIFIFFQTVPVGTGWGKSVQACSNTAPSSISHSGSVPGDCWNTWASTWLLKMPLELLSQEERCSAGGRKTLDRQALKKTDKIHSPFCSHSSVPDPPRPRMKLADTASLSALPHKHLLNHPSTCIFKRLSRESSCPMKTVGSRAFCCCCSVFSPPTFLYNDVVYIICSMGSLPFHWRVCFKYQHRLAF